MYNAFQCQFHAVCHNLTEFPQKKKNHVLMYSPDLEQSIKDM